MVQRVRLPVVGGLVRVLSPTNLAPTTEALTNLQAAVTALNAAVQTLQPPKVLPGSFSQGPTGTVKVTATIGGSPAFMASDSAPAADPSILVHRGRRGDEGEEGRHGYSGLPGAAGAAGAAGGAGRPGREGQQGDDGRRGAMGLGTPGAAGSAGAAGAAGVMGHKGDEGDEGRRGYPGTGAAGATGTPGAAGVPGRKGTDGDRGRRGYPGLGAPGATGATGAAGINGAVGSAVIVRGATFAATSGAVTTPVNDVELIFNAACTITRVTILTDGGAGSCVIDVWKAAIGSYPPAIGGDITGGVPPSISAGTTYDNSTLSGWTTAVAAGDVILLRLASSSTFTSISIQISLTTGAAGPVVGPQGFPGRQGEPGELGRMGAQGVRGPVGNTGATGLTGPVGLGARGLQGDPGEDGRRGVPGPLGQTGLTGTTGIQGAPGVSVVREGIEGEQGRRGVQGLVGAPGAQGVPGVAAHRPYHDEPHMFGRVRSDFRNIDGPVVIMNAGPANALTIASGVSAWGISIVSPNNAGLSYGMLITAGTSGADVALQVRSAAGNNLLLVYGDGSGFLGYATPGAVFTWNAAGAVTVNVPASGLQFNILDANGYGVYVSQEDSLNFNYGRNSTSDGYINYHGYADGATQFRSLNICNGKTGQLARFDATGIPLTLYGNNEVLQLHTNVARGSGQNYLEFDDPSGMKGYFGYGSGTNDNFYIYNGLANIAFFASGGLVMTLSGALGTGAVQATAGVLSTVSDERAKNNIHPFTHGLAEILKLKPILHGYDKKLSGIDTPRTDYPGFSAQNVQGAIPEAVEAGADGMLSLSDRGILAALVNAVQELAAKIPSK